MNYGFYKVAAITPKLTLGDVDKNVNEIKQRMDKAQKQEVSLAVFPELSLTGASSGDLFLNDTLITRSQKGLLEIIDHSKSKSFITIVGLPYPHLNKLYNVMAIIYQGELLALVTQTQTSHHFTKGPELSTTLFQDKEIPFGSDILLRNTLDSNFTFAVEIGEDFYAPNSPSTLHALAGATIIANGSADIETVTRANYRRDLIKSHSAKLRVGYILSSSGTGESSTDAVYCGHNLIAEDGELLKQSEVFSHDMTISEIDAESLILARRKQSSFDNNIDTHLIIDFKMKPKETTLTRHYPKNPFIIKDMSQRIELMFDLQAQGLTRRLNQIGSQTVILGLSGGLDSTLALLACVKAFQDNGWDTKNIITVTMPGFGTTNQSYENAVRLTNAYNTTLMTIDITNSVTDHLKSINHDLSVHDTTYENAQARKRTHILMDLANKHGGIVIGTGDLSELALGWATFNGDHMSMYSLNANIPKTLVKKMIQYVSETSEHFELLNDILEVPISPELLPSSDGQITQKTEDVIGPYELHDFFLYYFIGKGFKPSKVRYLALHTLSEHYSQAEIDRWLIVFIKRFFSQQFKRSTLPDGPRMGSVSLSPRAGFKMPSDTQSSQWLKELEDLIKASK